MLIKLYLDNEINEVFLGQASSVFLSRCPKMIRSEAYTRVFNSVLTSCSAPENRTLPPNPTHVNVVPNNVHVSTSVTKNRVREGRTEAYNFIRTPWDGEFAHKSQACDTQQSESTFLPSSAEV